MHSIVAVHKHCSMYIRVTILLFSLLYLVCKINIAISYYVKFNMSLVSGLFLSTVQICCCLVNYVNRVNLL